MGSWAGGGDEVASTCALAPAHRCHRPEKISAGGRGLWSRQPGSGAPAPAGGRSGRPDLSMDVGQFPYPRGETPVFNFDQGDEGFIGTIPPLIHALDAVKDTVAKQRKITQAFGEAFDLCEACG